MIPGPARWTRESPARQSGSVLAKGWVTPSPAGRGCPRAPPDNTNWVSETMLPRSSTTGLRRAPGHLTGLPHRPWRQPLASHYREASVGHREGETCPVSPRPCPHEVLTSGCVTLDSWVLWPSHPAGRGMQVMAVRWTGGWTPKAGYAARRSRWKHGPGPTPPSSPHTRPGQTVSPCGERLVMRTIHGAEKSSRHPAHSGVRSVPPNTLMFVQPGTCPWQGPCRPGGMLCRGSSSQDPGCPPTLPASR